MNVAPIAALVDGKRHRHALAEIRDDYHRIVYAANADAARADITLFRFPKAQRKSVCTTNVMERVHEEFRRREKTQGSLPSEDAALVLLFGLVTSGQLKLRRIDGWRKIAAVLSQHTQMAA